MKHMKYYGAKICGDCVAAAEAIEKNGLDIEFIDITASTANLKEFLKLRDTQDIFAEVRERGGIGIPCFVFDDGTVSFDLPGITSEAPGCAGCR